jgi:subtilisin family serine protease
LLLLLIPLAHAGPAADLPVYVPAKYIVVFRPGAVVDEVVNDFAGRFGIAVGHRYRHALRGMAATIPSRMLARLAADPRVAYIEQDMLVSVAAQTFPTGIDRVNAELNPSAHIDGVDIPADRIDVDIAILDTGIDLDHPDLHVYSYTYCRIQFSSVNCIEGDTGVNDVHGHGTQVAGIAGAIDNNTGVVGVAPGARLWAVKVLENNGKGTTSQIIAGVDYVTGHANEIEVANLSLTGLGASQALDAAIANSVAAGIVYTLAAGNNSRDVAGVFPAGHPDAITVSALEDYDGQPGGQSGSGVDDTFADLSNYGSGVDIMAPGVSIRSTIIGGGTGNNSGTSMAAPHVAGAAALYLSENPGVDPQSVMDALLATADPAPCANGPGGTCADDPDGIQEPLLMYASLADGDLNEDGSVDVRDILLGQRILMDELALTTMQLAHGDVAPLLNGVPQSDGVFSVADLMIIMRIALGDLTL